MSAANDEVQKKIKEYWDQYKTFTDKFSNILRQLAWTEIGVFWIFMYKSNCRPNAIIIGFFLLVLFFISDSLQYYLGLRDYYVLAKKSEDQRVKNPNIKLSEIEKTSSVNERANFCFYIKIIFISIASLTLVLYLVFG